MGWYQRRVHGTHLKSQKATTKMGERANSVEGRGGDAEESRGRGGSGADVVSTLLIAILVVLSILVSKAGRLQKEADDVGPRVSDMATRALEIMDDPLKMVLPETPLAYNVARVLMFDFSSFISQLTTLADAYRTSALLPGNDVGSPVSVTVANVILSVNARLSSMTFGTGSSITDGSATATLPSSPSSEYFDPILEFIQSVADAPSWKTLGEACTVFNANARAIDWSGSYLTYDTDLSGDWVVSGTTLWNANSQVDDITTSID